MLSKLHYLFSLKSSGCIPQRSSHVKKTKSCYDKSSNWIERTNSSFLLYSLHSNVKKMQKKWGLETVWSGVGAKKLTKSCQNNIHGSFSINRSISKLPKIHQSFRATFESKFVDHNFQKSPNLITLLGFTLDTKVTVTEKVLLSKLASFPQRRYPLASAY